MTKIAIIGGFLGAGKTTTIIELGKRLSKLGKRIGIITNDQGEMLVDTKIVKDFGFSTREGQPSPIFKATPASYKPLH